MKIKKLTFVFLVCVGSFIAASQNANAKDCGNAQDMNGCFCADTYEQDGVLNKVYQQALKNYKDDQQSLKRLKEAQRAWIKFRDAQLELSYPSTPEAYYGSYRMCKCMLEKDLITQRIAQLQSVLRPSEDDVCHH